MKLAGCVVLYHPDEQALTANILTYMQEVDYLFILDNSTTIINYDFSFLKEENYEYITNNGNIGIAAALNKACASAKTKGYEWILTMDQDSSFEVDGLSILKNSLQLSLASNNIGILTPTLKDVNFIARNKTHFDLQDAQAINTSGNILNIKAWSSIGGFNEKLFIDSVDTDLCFKLILAKFKIFIVPNAFLNHSEGEMKNVSLLKYKVLISQHNYIRRYYITRNRSFIIATYYRHFPSFCTYLLKCQVSEFVKMLFFESDKLKKTRSFFLGFKDFLFKKYGKYHY